MPLALTRKWLSGREAVGRRHRRRLEGVQGARNTAAMRSQTAIKAVWVRRWGRMGTGNEIHTKCSDQEARRALTRRFDLIPYTAAAGNVGLAGECEEQ
jgi:hypothetical protein